MNSRCYGGRIYIVGFTGVGKTTLGRKFANLNGFEWIDTDFEIEKEFNTRLSDLTQIKDGALFKQEESKVLSDSLHKVNTVISTGSGTVSSVENRNILRNSLTIFLQDSVSNMYNRGFDRNINMPIKETQSYEHFEKEYSKLRVIYDRCSKYTFNLENDSETEIFSHINDAVLLDRELHSFVSKTQLEKQQKQFEEWLDNNN